MATIIILYIIIVERYAAYPNSVSHLSVAVIHGNMIEQ